MERLFTRQERTPVSSEQTFIPEGHRFHALPVAYLDDGAINATFTQPERLRHVLTLYQNIYTTN